LNTKIHTLTPPNQLLNSLSTNKRTPPNHRKQLNPQLLTALKKTALSTNILNTTLNNLNTHQLNPQTKQIIKQNLHIQHPNIIKHLNHYPTPNKYNTHTIQTTQKSQLHNILKNQIKIPTYHHQNITAHPNYITTT